MNRIKDIGNMVLPIRTKGEAIACKIIALWWLEVMKNTESEVAE